MSMELRTNEPGGYRFLPGIAPYSSGVVALPGFEIAHVNLESPREWQAGMRAARQYVESFGLSRHCLCAFELRCPTPYTLAGFVEFNDKYRRLLNDWQMLVEGLNPVARTNVAPVVSPPSDSVLFAFSYVRPSSLNRPTFVVAGGGELPDGELAERRIVYAGETSPAALLKKAECVVGLMNDRRQALGVGDELLTTIDVYTAHPLQQILESVVLPQIPASRRRGVTWYYARPPIVDIEFEMDMRGVLHEQVATLT